MKVEFQLKGDRIWVRSPYSPILVGRFGIMPGRKFEGKQNGNAWSFPACKDVILMLADVCGVIVDMLPEPIRALMGPPKEVKREVLDMSLLDDHVFKTEQFEHQKQNLVRLIANDRWLIADEAGTGKSSAVANMLKRYRNVCAFPAGFRALILAPKSVCSGWVKQLEEHGGIKCGQVVMGAPEERRNLLLGRWASPVQITNYEAVLHTREFQDVKWSVIVLDELQKIKNFTAASAKVVRKLTDRCPAVYGLSGTPTPNGLQDWLGVIAAIRPDLAPKNQKGEITKGAFEAEFILKARIGDNGPWRIAGYRNVEELHGIIQQFTSRNTKADCLDLPGKVFLDRTVALEGDQARIYRDLKRDAVARLNAMGSTITARNILTESLRLMQVVGGFVGDDDGNQHELHPKAKVEGLDEILEEVGDKQVVIWCAFKAEVAWLADKLRDQGGVEVLTGDCTQNERAVAIDAFKNGDVRYFIATAAAGGTGVNGLQVADVEVFYSRDWNLGNYLQAQDRLDRLGQQNKVSVYKLIAEGTVDERVDALLDQKEDMMSMMLRRPEDIL